MKIGIFGGSFNPPHKMHENMVKELLNKQCVDKIIFVPTGNMYKYKNNLLPDYNRIQMLELIAAKNEGFAVSDFECKDYPVYTCDTLANFKEMYPNDEIYFICGADNLSYVDKWKTGLELLANNKFLVVKRNGENIDELLEKYKDYRHNIVISDVEPRDISSTQIRELIRSGKREELEELLDKDVIEYIYKEKLYTDYL